MRKIELSEINLRNKCDEETFYKLYLNELQKDITKDNNFINPSKEYEIFYLNILGGKIILLNKKYILNKDISNQDLYYDYANAFKIYNLLLDIYDGIEDEKNEINELYKEERIKKEEYIKKLQLEDEELFLRKRQEYYIIVNSNIYKEYIRLQIYNEKLKKENNDLREKLNNNLKQNFGFFSKILNKLFTKKLPNKWMEKIC